MKESEAKTKLCPLTGGEETAGKCVGSECMWWRETSKDNGDCCVPLLVDVQNGIWEQGELK